MRRGIDLFVIPAKAETQSAERRRPWLWAPGFAGVAAH